MSYKGWRLNKKIMKQKIDIFEEEIDILMEKIDEVNLPKYNKKELFNKYWELIGISDDLEDKLKSGQSEKYENCISKLKKLTEHFYYSKYSDEYDAIFQEEEENKNIIEGLHLESNKQEETMQEKDIFDLIINSAKTRFDYATFEKAFSKKLADDLLFRILVHLAKGDNPGVITANIEMILLTTQGQVFENANAFITDNADKWKREVDALNMSADMLNSGFYLENVFDSVSKILSK
jgi:hypothetical protein